MPNTLRLLASTALALHIATASPPAAQASQPAAGPKLLVLIVADIVPTFAAAAGVDVGAVDGRVLSEALAGGSH